MSSDGCKTAFPYALLEGLRGVFPLVPDQLTSGGGNCCRPSDRVMIAFAMLKLERTALQTLCRLPALPSPLRGTVFKKEVRSSLLVTSRSGALLATVPVGLAQ